MLIDRVPKDKIPGEKYLYTYILDPTKQAQTIIEDKAKADGLSIVAVGDNIPPMRRSGPQWTIPLKTGILVEEWLAYIKNADFIITDSFHGICFSIIFHKQFIALVNKIRAPRFESLLGDGHQFGVHLTYAVQPSPDGLAQAFIIGEDFIGKDTVAMVLGDNIFSGHGLKKRLKAAVKNAEEGKGATVFGYYVDDPERFGIVEFDKEGKAVSIEEKPAKPKSNYCVTGLYFYDNRVVEYAKNLKPSARGELEITDLNRIYLENGDLNVELLGQGFTWLDTGTHESLVDATNFVKTLETHQHRKIACLEEIGYLNGWITKEDVLKVYEVLKKNQYGQYLKDVLEGKYLD